MNLGRAERAGAAVALSVLLTGCGPQLARSVTSPPPAAIQASPTPSPSPSPSPPPATITGTVPVVPCPIPAGELSGWPYKLLLAAATYRLPAGFALPAGLSVFGTPGPFGKGDSPTYGAAPRGYVCQAQFYTGDAGFVDRWADPASGAPVVSQVMHAGGAGPSLQLVCPYIPAAATAFESAGGQWPAQMCARPAGVTVTNIPTGITASYLVAVVAPPGVRLPAGIGSVSTGSGHSTLALITFTSNSALVAQSLGTSIAAVCGLPDSQRDLCLGTLSFFLRTQSVVGLGMSPASMSAALAELQTLLAG